MIVAGTGIEVPPSRFGLSGDGADTPPCGPLEEHVLQHVRDPGPPIRLVEKASLDVRDHSYHWCGMIRLDQQRQTIGENLAVDSCGPERWVVGGNRKAGR
jgi:hypothetical protein